MYRKFATFQLFKTRYPNFLKTFHSELQKKFLFYHQYSFSIPSPLPHNHPNNPNNPTTRITLIFSAQKYLLWKFFLLQEKFLIHPSLIGFHLDILLRPSENWAVCILPTCARSLLKMSSSQDWLIVSMQGGHTAADEGQRVEYEEKLRGGSPLQKRKRKL